MLQLNRYLYKISVIYLTVCSFDLQGASQGGGGSFSNPSSTPFNANQSSSTKKGAPAPVKPVDKDKKVKPTLPSKDLFPVMSKPFGMPGVIGWEDDKWEGQDFLGQVTSNIAVSVEILKGETVPSAGISEGTLETLVRDAFKKGGLNPETSVEEGPPLPFLHILVVIYQVDEDKFAVYRTARLFEQVQVMRKNFIPAGYWQGIMWESLEIQVATVKTLPEVVSGIVESGAQAFLGRYRAYNPTNPDTPNSTHLMRRPAETPPATVIIPSPPEEYSPPQPVPKAAPVEQPTPPAPPSPMQAWPAAGTVRH